MPSPLVSLSFMCTDGERGNQSKNIIYLFIYVRSEALRLEYSSCIVISLDLVHNIGFVTWNFKEILILMENTYSVFSALSPYLMRQSSLYGSSVNPAYVPWVCVLSCSVVSDSYNHIRCCLPGSSGHGISQARILE